MEAFDGFQGNKLAREQAETEVRMNKADQIIVGVVVEKIIRRKEHTSQMEGVDRPWRNRLTRTRKIDGHESTNKTRCDYRKEMQLQVKTWEQTVELHRGF